MFTDANSLLQQYLPLVDIAASLMIRVGYSGAPFVAAGRAEQLVPDGCELFDRQHRFWAHAKQDSHASLDILEPTNILSRVPSAEASHNTAVDWHRPTCDGSEGF